MAKRNLVWKLLLGASMLAGCATAGHILPSASELAAASGADAEALARGRAAYVRECAECHRQYWPEERSPRDWARIAPDMADRSGLSEALGSDVTRFLIEASRAARAGT